MDPKTKPPTIFTIAQEIAHMKKHREAIIKRIGLEKYQELLWLLEQHEKRKEMN